MASLGQSRTGLRGGRTACSCLSIVGQPGGRGSSDSFQVSPDDQWTSLKVPRSGFRGGGHTSIGSLLAYHSVMGLDAGHYVPASHHGFFLAFF